jgi:hypothetical protein
VQITRTTPRRRTILHLSQIRLTDARTFISSDPQILRSSNLLDYPSPAAIDRRELDPHAIADQHADEIPVDPIRNVRRDNRALLEPHAVKRAGELLRNDANDFHG